MRQRTKILVVVILLIMAGGLGIVYTANWRGERKLRAALQGATLLRVRTGGTCHRFLTAEKTLIEEKSPAEIQNVIANIRIASIRDPCMCCGSPTLEFYRGNTLIAMLGFHHGRALRWPGGWNGDGELTDGSRAFIVKWLADGGAKGPQLELQQEEERQLAMERKVARAPAHGIRRPLPVQSEP